MQYTQETFSGIFTDHFIHKCGQFEKKEKAGNLNSISITYKTKGIIICQPYYLLKVM